MESLIIANIKEFSKELNLFQERFNIKRSKISEEFSSEFFKVLQEITKYIEAKGEV